MNIFKKEDKKPESLKEFVCKIPACTFTIPARLTVRQQMEYFSASAGASGKEMVSRLWEGAKVLIVDWNCEIVPDFKQNTDEMYGADQAELITWAAVQVKAYVESLENVPKNS